MFQKRISGASGISLSMIIGTASGTCTKLLIFIRTFSQLALMQIKCFRNPSRTKSKEQVNKDPKLVAKMVPKHLSICTSYIQCQSQLNVQHSRNRCHRYYFSWSYLVWSRRSLIMPLSVSCLNHRIK